MLVYTRAKNPHRGLYSKVKSVYLRAVPGQGVSRHGSAQGSPFSQRWRGDTSVPGRENKAKLDEDKREMGINLNRVKQREMGANPLPDCQVKCP